MSRHKGTCTCSFVLPVRRPKSSSQKIFLRTQPSQSEDIFCFSAYTYYHLRAGECKVRSWHVVKKMSKSCEGVKKTQNQSAILFFVDYGLSFVHISERVPKLYAASVILDQKFFRIEIFETFGLSWHGTLVNESKTIFSEKTSKVRTKLQFNLNWWYSGLIRSRFVYEVFRRKTNLFWKHTLATCFL